MSDGTNKETPTIEDLVAMVKAVTDRQDGADTRGGTSTIADSIEVFEGRKRHKIVINEILKQRAKAAAATTAAGAAKVVSSTTARHAEIDGASLKELQAMYESADLGHPGGLKKADLADQIKQAEAEG